MGDETPISPEFLYVERRAGGGDDPTLVLLHGLGATGAVWDPMLSLANWSGPIVVPDLRGHGASPWVDRYSIGAMASDVSDLLEPDERCVVAGHSLGGAVALTIASGWFGVEVERLITIGIKATWSDDELAMIPRIASKPPRVFDDRQAATDWALKLAGLFGVIENDDPIMDRAVRQIGAGWIASNDPKSGTVGPPHLDSTHAALTAPVIHTMGADDTMSSPDELAPYGPTHVFDGCGHNPMVEDPAALWDVIRR